MAGNQINIGLRFNADTGQARQQLQSLKQSLLELGNISNISPTTKLNADINESIAAVAKLRVSLEAATNVNTGRLDLTKFNKQLRNSGMDLTKYRTQLSALGPEGQKAFLGLATSIQSAEVPLLTLNKLATSLWTSLARTAKWQMSSTAIHAVIGGFQKAYGYVQDLNESLNNIRIVSGQSVDQMAKFAVEANKAAKALGTTTKAYADASLIYYQQGLNDDEVKARTDVTVKMANVIGQSAEQVSQDLTAVWNNFAKGGENLERFADKMVALGASTASSSQEIATGLEKFAAIAETTGLSFDYAAAALATVTAQTRLSAETVGTAFKTIFSRLDSLKLGETLEDGTDLTKYSEALSVVGVNIKDANGELKSMNEILDQTMAAWETLSQDQKVALASTVAGQRQYTQFMALMSNSDFFRKNLKTINESTGALEDQNKIYQESWEATSKKVQAAMEEIYSKVLDDKFFIGATKQLERFITMISRVIDSMGGISGVVFTITAALTHLFNEQISTGIRNITFDIKNLISHGREAEQLRQEAANQVSLMMQNSNDTVLLESGRQYQEISKLTNEIANKQQGLNQFQKDQLSTMLQMRQLQADRIIELAAEADAIKKNNDLTKEGITDISNEYLTDEDLYSEDMKQERKQKLDNIVSKEKNLSYDKSFRTNKSIKDPADSITNREEEIRNLEEEYNKTVSKLGKIKDEDKNSDKAKNLRSKEQDLQNEIEHRKQQLEELKGLVKEEEQIRSANDFIEQRAKVSGDNKTLYATMAEDYQQLATSSHLVKQSIQDLPIERLNAFEQVINSDDAGAEEKAQALTKISQSFKEFFNDLGSSEGTQQIFIESINEIITSSEELDSAFAKGEDESFEAWIQRLMDNGVKIQEFSNLFEQARQKIQGDANDFRQQIINVIDTSNLPEQTKEELKQYFNDISNGAAKAATSLLNLSRAQRDGAQSSKGLVQALNSASAIKDFATYITNATRALSSLGMGLSAISGIVNTLNNDDLNWFEKLQQIMISLPMAINSVIMPLNMLNSTQDGLLAKRKKANADKILSIALTKAEASADERSALALELSAAAKDKNSNADTYRNILQKAGITGKKQEIIAEALSTGAIDAETAAKATNNGVTATRIGLLWAELWPLLAIAAAIGTIVAVVYLAIKQYNKASEAAKDAAENSKKAAEAANEAKEAYENLKNTVNGYDEAIKKTQELTKGTLEYKEALAEANENAIELIKNNPGMAYHYDENGMIVFDNDNELIEAQEKAFEKSQNLKANASQAEAIANTAQQKANIVDFSRKNLHTVNGYGVGNTAVGYVGGAAAGALGVAGAGALIGSAVPVLGTAIGAVVGALIGGIGAAISSGVIGAATEGEKQATQKLIDIYADGNADAIKLINEMKVSANPTELIDDLQELTGASADVASAMAASAEELAEFVETQSQINVENELLLRDALRNRLSNNDTFNKSDYQEALISDIRKIQKDKDSEEYIKAEQTYDSKSREQRATDYMQMTFGDDWNKNYMYKDLGGGNITLMKKVEGGGWENLGNAQSVSWDNIKEQLIDEYTTQEALKNLPQSESEKNALGDAFKNIISTYSGRDADDKDLQNIISDAVNKYSQGKALDLTGLTFEEIRKLSNSSDKFNSFGLDDDQQAALQEAVAGAEEAKRNTNKIASVNYEKNREGLQASMFAEAAEAANITSEEFDLYAKSIQNANEALALSETESKQAATDIIKTSKAVSTLGESYDDVKDTLAKIKKNDKAILSPEEVQDLTQIQSTLKDWLGVEFDFEEIAKNSDLIEKAIRQDAEAIRDLQKEAAKKIALNFDTSDENKQKFNQFLEELDSLVGENQVLEIGATLNLENGDAFAETINQMLHDGEIAADQLEQFFQAAGVAAQPDGAQEIELPPNHTHTVSENTITVNGKEERKEHVESDVTTTSIVSVPKYNGQSFKSLGSGRVQKLGESKNSGNSKSSGSGSGKKKSVDSEIDRYHEVNRSLDALSKKYNQLNTEKERAFGGKHLAAIDAEIDVLKAEEKMLGQREAQAREYLAYDRAKVEKYGAVFDANGNIANYNDIIARNIGLDDEVYSDMKSALSAYESSLDTLNDTLEEKAEKARQILDAEFEKIEYTVDVKIQIVDFDNKILDWQLKQLENRDFKSAERVAQYIKQGENAEKTFDANKQGILDVFKTIGMSDAQIEKFLAGDVKTIEDIVKTVNDLDISDKVKTDVQQFIEGMMDSHEQLLEIKKAIEEELTVSWEEFNNKIEETMGLYDHLQKKIDFFRDITDVLGMKRLGMTAEAIERMNASALNLQQKQIQSLKDQWDMNNELLVKARAARAEAVSEEDQEYWDNIIKDVQNKLYELEGNILDQGKSLIEAIQQDFEQSVENVFSEFEDKMAGMYSSFEDMQEAFDQQKTLKEEYLPAYEKVYELSKMNRNLNKEMSKLSSTASQEKLRDLQEEINQLQADGVEMSKYDLEYLQKKYDLRLAEIAMEEARNNKNQVRLTRDTSGNYNYVYTTDSDTEDKTAQSYEDAMYQAQKTSEDYITSTSENLLKLQQEYVDKLKQIWLDWENGLITTEQRNAKIKQINEFYTKQLQFVNGEINKALSNNASLYTQEYLIYAATRGLMEQEGKNFTTDFNQTIIGNSEDGLGIIGGYARLEDYLNDFLTNLGTVDGSKDTVLGKLSVKANAMEQYINTVLQTVANTDMENFWKDSKEQLDKVDTEVGEVETAIKTLEENGKSYFDLLVGDISAAQLAMHPKLSDMKDDIEAVSGAFQTMIDTMVTAQNEYQKSQNILNGGNVHTGGESDDGSGGNETIQTTITTIPTPTPSSSFNPKNYTIADLENMVSQKNLIPKGTRWVGVEGEEENAKLLNGVAPMDINIGTRQDIKVIKGNQLFDRIGFKSVKNLDIGFYEALKKDFEKGLREKFGKNSVYDIYLFYDELTKKYYSLDDIFTKTKTQSPLDFRFDTGGYTGAWGQNGKLAMLHEKELVLNKQDTQNMLATVDLVRQLSNMIDLQKISRQIDSVRYNNSLSNYSNSLNNLQQEIHIDASFPGVTAREEIEQAFADLAVQATKYIHRY